MERYVTNETISLGHMSLIGTEGGEYQLNVIKSENVITPPFVLLSKTGQIIIHCFSWINALVFTYFRLIVYKYFFKQFKKKEVNSVNVLTMIVCFFQHLEVFWYLILQVILLWVGNEYSERITPWLCLINNNVILIMWCHSALGGLGIATYRIMLIKHDELVKDVIGRKRLMCIILSCEFFILICVVGSLSIRISYWDPIQPPCMYMVPVNMLETLDTYRQSIGNQPFLSYHKMHRISLAFFSIAATLSEVFIYVVFFHHMYKHDNNERLRKLLGNEVISERNRKNAISFLSLFFSFLVELFFLIIVYFFAIFEKKDNVGFILPIRTISLAAIAVVEAVTSCALRSKFW